jgi:hypothetical protein
VRLANSRPAGAIFLALALGPASAGGPPEQGVRISEVLADTTGAPAVEFIEIHNAGPRPEPLEDWYLLDDKDSHEPCPLAGTLQPGEYLVVASDLAAFARRWKVPNVNPHAFGGDGQGTGFGLGNRADEVRLLRREPGGDRLVHRLAFAAQSAGISYGYLLRDSEVPEYLLFPTPGSDNEVTKAYSPVCINEFHTTGEHGGADDWVELYNRSATPVDVGGWHLTDDATRPDKFAIPAGTVIPAGGFLSFDETELGFAFRSEGTEVILLTHADGATGQDYIDFAAQYPNVSQGRFPDGASRWRFFGEPSRDGANRCCP